MSLWYAGAATWVVLLVFAVASGAAREQWSARYLGDHLARQVHTLVGCAVNFAAALGLVAATGERSGANLWALGGAWLAATVCFECVFGRYMLHKSWSELFLDYNIFKGRLWPLFLASLASAPWLAARAMN